MRVGPTLCTVRGKYLKELGRLASLSCQSHVASIPNPTCAKRRTWTEFEATTHLSRTSYTWRWGTKFPKINCYSAFLFSTGLWAESDERDKFLRRMAFRIWRDYNTNRSNFGHFLHFFLSCHQKKSFESFQNDHTSNRIGDVAFNQVSTVDLTFLRLNELKSPFAHKWRADCRMPKTRFLFNGSFVRRGIENVFTSLGDADFVLGLIFGLHTGNQHLR